MIRTYYTIRENVRTAFDTRLDGKLTKHNIMFCLPFYYH